MNGAIPVRRTAAADAVALTRLNTAFNGGNEPPEALAARMADPITKLGFLADELALRKAL